MHTIQTIFEPGNLLYFINRVAFAEQKFAGETEIVLKGKLKNDLFTSLKACLRNSDAVRKRFKKYL